MNKEQILEMLPPYPSKEMYEGKTEDEVKLIEEGYHYCIDNLLSAFSDIQKVSD